MYYFIVNPNSRSGRGRLIWEQIHQQLLLQRISAKALKNQLLGSDAVLVFADATVLCQGRNVVEWQQMTGATKINPLFNLLNREMGDRPLTVLFVLTKTDDERIPKEMKRNNFAVLSERAVQTFGMI